MASRPDFCTKPRSGRIGRRELLAAALASLAAAPLAGALGAEVTEADTSPRAREDAISRLPLDKLNEETQRKLLSVVERSSLFRRMPTKTIDCDTDLYLFLLRNPEVVVNIWELMGVSNMTAERTGAFTWKGNDGAGTICNVELIYGTDDLHVLYGDGYYEGALLKRKINGRCVLLLHSGYRQGQDARPYVGNQLDVFLTIDNVGADLIAKTLHPWVGATIDTNFGESAKFLSRMSQAAERNGSGMQRLADKLERVQPDVRDRFTRVSTAVNQRAAIREAKLGLETPAIPVERR